MFQSVRYRPSARPYEGIPKDEKERDAVRQAHPRGNAASVVRHFGSVQPAAKAALAKGVEVGAGRVVVLEGIVARRERTHRHATFRSREIITQTNILTSASFLILKSVGLQSRIYRTIQMVLPMISMLFKLNYTKKMKIEARQWRAMCAVMYL